MELSTTDRIPRDRRARRRGTAVGAVVVALAVALAACGGTTPSTAGTRGPQPAGRLPSPIAVMVCAKEAQKEINSALGLTAVVPTRTWVDHKYSCPYRYPAGASFVLSVQELSSWSQTLAYYAGLGRQLGRVQNLKNLGQGAFQTTDGSVVVRKDWKVLLVDVTGLPPAFGVPPTSKADVAVTVADVILGCWAGD